MSRFSVGRHLTSRRTPLFTFELVATAYFGVLAALSLLTGASRRWPGMGVAAGIFAGAIVALSRVLGVDARLWLGHLYLIAGYWLPALLVTRSPHRFEKWLLRTESFGSFGPFGAFGAFWELAYLCCYPIVPAAFLTVYLTGSIADVDRFWTAVLAAGYLCYISLPWLVSRPPRIAMRSSRSDRSTRSGRSRSSECANLPDDPNPLNGPNRPNGPNESSSWVRRLNVKVLDRFSHGWNTFPSGHVAVAIAAALAVARVERVAGIVLLVIAVGIAIGSVAGRYHYTVDAVAGTVVGVTIPAMLARLMSVVALIVLTSAVLHAQANGDATRGQALFKERCAVCHGEALEGLVGPPLKGPEFAKTWSSQPALVDKIQKTMPQDEPGSLTAAQASDLAAFVVRAGATAATSTPAALVASHDTPTFPPAANLGQLMRGIFFPSSNLIFEVQGHDPGEKRDGKPYEPSANDNFSWAQWGAGIYSPWEIVDYAALSIADAAPLLLVPGRRCENGRAVPSDRDDWKKFTQELIDAGKAAYKASQSRSQEAVSDVSNQIADACLHCHEVYRDKPGGTTADPSNKAARCF